MDLTSWSAADHATATLMNARVQANFNAIGATSTYTPTVGGTGWAKGNGTLTGYYIDTGANVNLTIKFILGTTSTGGTGGLTFSVPVGSVATGRAVGSLLMVKGGGAFVGACDIITSTIDCYVVSSAAGALGFLVNGAPSAGNWTTADAIYLSINYFR